MDSLYLGLDLSTQQLKLTVVSEALSIVLEERVSFDEELPEFGTKNGVHIHTNEAGRVTSPTKMWLKAIDLLFAKLQAANFPFNRVAAISGCAQQHATVYWRRGASEVLGKLNPQLSLLENLGEQFSVPESPIWMDSSTSAECNEIEKHFSGEVHKVTGSRCYERFSGMQIAKIFRTARPQYEQTERIALASSFFASLLIGSYAAMDASDASGMNLLEIEPKQVTKGGETAFEYQWNRELCALMGDGLQQRLGDVVRSGVAVGSVSHYWSQRFGFSHNCVVAAFTGDNPASCVGIGMQSGDMCVSLGTSDTCFALADHAEPRRVAHVFYSPLSTDDRVGYLILACFKNGSLLREEVRNKHAKSSWCEFENALQRTPAGNSGRLGFFFTVPEILPDGLVGTFRFEKVEQEWKPVQKSFEDDVEVRAVCESQMLSRRLYCERLGLRFQDDSNQQDASGNSVKRVLITGGASKNDELVRLVANVFGKDVYRLRDEIANSASLGGALLAHRAIRASSATASSCLHDYVCVAQADRLAFESYTRLLSEFETLENQVIQLHNQRK